MRCCAGARHTFCLSCWQTEAKRRMTSQPFLQAGFVAAVLLVGFVLTRALKRTGVSPMILLSIAGLVVGSFVPQRLLPNLGPIFLGLFLPALVFEAAWDSNVRALRRAALAIGVLAGPG